MKRSPHILLLFLDGVGVGGKEHNPFFNSNLPSLKRLLNGKIPHLRDSAFQGQQVSLKQINATLGVPGLPQSGTGQTALLTGINAQRLIGKHFGPYLHSALKPIIEGKNIFRQLSELGKKCFYANAFPHQYFDYLASKKRIAAISHAWLTSGNLLNDHASLESGKSISADMTNERWHKLGYPFMPIISAEEAGRRLAKLTRQYDFVLYEYFYTDHAGHSRSMKEAVSVLEGLDSLLGGILDTFDPETTSMIITSDHGNLEDLSTKSHTRNPVPMLAYGDSHLQLSGSVNKITDVTKAIVNVMS